jgi:magnesium-transporting ATPase (P-type)
MAISERHAAINLLQVLIITMAISFGIKDYIEGSVIAAVISLNIVVGFTQDWRAEQQIQALKALSAPLAKVIRNGRFSTIKAEGVVTGDLVQIGVGDKVAADARLVDGINLSTDESHLTGESLTVSKKPDLVLATLINGKPTAMGDRKNMIYSGSVITQGRGTAIIVATGELSEFGKIADLMDERKAQKEKDKDKSLRARIWALFVSHARTILGLDGTPLMQSLSKYVVNYDSAKMHN